MIQRIILYHGIFKNFQNYNLFMKIMSLFLGYTLWYLGTRNMVSLTYSPITQQNTIEGERESDKDRRRDRRRRERKNIKTANMGKLYGNSFQYSHNFSVGQKLYQSGNLIKYVRYKTMKCYQIITSCCRNISIAMDTFSRIF